MNKSYELLNDCNPASPLNPPILEALNGSVPPELAARGQIHTFIKQRQKT